jgi:FAD/FMN-containing dehydrogenase
MTSTLGSDAVTDIASLKGQMTGELLTPGAPGYDEARRVWNGAVDRYPAVIVRCREATDVAAAITFGRANGLPIAVRGGGHSIPGLSVCDGGVMIDLQPMKGIKVDPRRRTADVEPGVLWAELDAATQEHGLAVTGGEVSDTGVAGLTLGGGFGWLTRTCGMTSDNLLEAEVVTADGRIVRASADEHPDLFWGLRGGGGNFGVVTRFTFQLHEVGPMLYGGAVFHAGEDAVAVMRAVRDMVSHMPDEVGVCIALVTAPPAPEFPEHLHGKPIVVVAAAYHGDVSDGEEVLRPLRELGSPRVDMLGPIPYVALQQMVDAFTPKGLQYYVKSEWLSGLPDGVIDDVVQHHFERTSPMHQILLRIMGGAVRRLPDDATAFAYRDTEWAITIAGCWASPEEDREPHVAWVRSVWEASRPVTLGGGYVNHLDVDEGADRVRAAYGPETYARLARVKKAWDPDNVFRLNQNILPE